MVSSFKYDRLLAATAKSGSLLSYLVALAWHNMPFASVESHTYLSGSKLFWLESLIFWNWWSRRLRGEYDNIYWRSWAENWRKVSALKTLLISAPKVRAPIFDELDHYEWKMGNALCLEPFLRTTFGAWRKTVTSNPAMNGQYWLSSRTSKHKSILKRQGQSVLHYLFP